MIPVYLIGGGRNNETFPHTFGRFLKKAAKNGKRKIALIVAEEEGGDSEAQFLRFFKAFESVGLSETEAVRLFVSKEDNLTKEKLARIEPTGVFVCGGLTPAYFESLCLDKSWLGYLFENKIPFCGFSAGSSVASEKAVIGGWRREINGRTVEIADENASEDLDILSVREGLGLVDFSVDVHATQWGTLSRLVHAIDAGLADEGRAIDENTMLEIIDGKINIFGAGNVYHFKRQNGKIEISIYRGK